ncbi:chemotaxis protein [Escherichia coli]|nr:chemotaxis protein [Escherichia coli]TDH54232.1 chemotaxis protein [Escherichia coli]
MVWVSETPLSFPSSFTAVTNGAIVIHTQRLKSDPGGNLLS